MVKFSDLGSKISDDVSAPINTERTTEDILSVLKGYTTKSLTFSENFVSLEFW